MLANTLTLTINAIAKVLVRVNQDNFGSQYQLKSATESIVMKIRTSTDTNKGQLFDRHNVEVVHTVYGVAPAPDKVYTCSMTFRSIDKGDPVALGYLMTGFSTLLSAQQAAIIGGEV